MANRSDLFGVDGLGINWDERITSSHGRNVSAQGGQDLDEYVPSDGRMLVSEDAAAAQGSAAEELGVAFDVRLASLVNRSNEIAAAHLNIPLSSNSDSEKGWLYRRSRTCSTRSPMGASSLFISSPWLVFNL